MPTSTIPSQPNIFGDSYPRIGEYVQDDSLIPYFNPSGSAQFIRPGEPLLVQYGPTTEERVFLSQLPLWPGYWGMLIRRFTADLPCNFSADVIMGAEVYWDLDNEQCSLNADVTNGFTIGEASYAFDPNIRNTPPAVDGNGRVIVATSTSTVVRVISRDAAVTTKGAVTPLVVQGGPAPEEEPSQTIERFKP